MAKLVFYKKSTLKKLKKFREALKKGITDYVNNHCVS